MGCAFLPLKAAITASDRKSMDIMWFVQGGKSYSDIYREDH